MSFTAQLPDSCTIKWLEKNVNDLPGAGSIGCVHDNLVHSYITKVSSVVNPVCLQSDVIYPNILGAGSQYDLEISGNAPTCVAQGCVGHMVDNEFPFESRAPFSLPLIMYPTDTTGRQHHEADLCGLPVLNWEKYINKIRVSDIRTGRNCPGRKKKDDKNTGFMVNPYKNRCDPKYQAYERLRQRIAPSPLNDSPISLPFKKMQEMFITSTKTQDVDMTKSSKICIQSEGTDPDSGKTSAHDSSTYAYNYATIRKDSKLTKIGVTKLKNIPNLRVEGTWNYLFGGYNGACCFIKTGSSIKTSSTKLKLFVGKGALLRSVELEKALPSSIFSYSAKSIWEEDGGSLPFNKSCLTHHPHNDLIFQIIRNEPRDLLGVRRGKSVQIYSVEEEMPYVLESIPNTCYGSSKYYHCNRRDYIEDPLITGIDFNPIFPTEIVTIDENNVVSFCNFGEGCITDTFVLPKDNASSFYLATRPKGYPCFKLNEASGITYANCNELFYGWSDSVVYLGDRRDPAISRSHLMPLLNLRKSHYMCNITDQYAFLKDNVQINEFVSCVRSSHEPYYYIGTSSKVFLMDRRVPDRPVLKVNHGLQSPLAYMDIVSDDYFDILVGGSQRLPETMCMIMDRSHTACVSRSGCEAKNPILYTYPRHLSNQRMQFDFAVREGYNFSFPNDFERIKSHHYAWSSGITAYPLHVSDPTVPTGIVAVTSNNFGDLFWQEWDQRPLESHKKVQTDGYKLKTFMTNWKEAVTPNAETYKIKPSINRKVHSDCSILLEPAAAEIMNLRRIRRSQFDCFRPNQLQYDSNSQTVKLIDSFIPYLRKYKNKKSKGMMDIWSHSDILNIDENNSIDSAAEVVIKQEPQEHFETMSLCSVNTIEISAGEQEIVVVQEDEQLSEAELVHEAKDDKSDNHHI